MTDNNETPEIYTLGRFRFDTKEEYDTALKELALIKIIRREADTSNPSVASDLYKKLRFRKELTGTSVGRSFLHSLAATAAKGEEENKKSDFELSSAAFPPHDEAVEKKATDTPIKKEAASPQDGSSRTGNKKLALLLTASASILIFMYCVARLVIYSISSYYYIKDTSALKELIGTSSIQLGVDESTGRPVAYSQNTVTKAPDTIYEKEAVLDKYAELYRLNSDLVGWISIDDTRIDYPVMQTVFDEEYYLHRGYDKEEADEGLPFMDSRCNVNKPSTNLLIYGHNMKNGDMFADLLKYEDKSYYENHKFIRFDTIYEECIYEIIAVFRSRVAFVDENTFRFYNFIESHSTAEFYDYMANIRNLSLYDIDATAISDDYLLTLTTCEYSTDDGRFVVVARKITDIAKEN